jgi:hypothetical protein
MIKPDYYIGIDPGIVCGLAFYRTWAKQFYSVRSCKLHELITAIDTISKGNSIEVFIENPNTWVPFKNVSREVTEMKRAGAGAVKQTFKHIIEFLEDNNIPYQTTRLQGNMKKMKSDKFKQMTGWDKPTNEHGRDAACLVFGR